ncbi:MAG: pyridoxamine 5'-phosphate oxidase family protein [Syntrophorhabdaceae bacterium]
MTEKKIIPSTTQKGVADIYKRLSALAAKESFAVLATNEQGRPYASLISFAITPDLKTLLFATPKNTRKFRNIRDTKDVALLIDNRTNKNKGFIETQAITILGKATAIRRGREWLEYAGIFLKKHPDLEEFINASTTALIAVNIESCVHVGNFQTVTIMDWDT